MRPRSPILTRGGCRTLMLTTVIVLPPASMLGGCVASESSRYQRKLSYVVQPDDRASEEVAMAFELDDYAPDRVSVAVMSDTPSPP